MIIKPSEYTMGTNAPKKRSNSLVVQKHHISYDPPVIVPIFQGEHWLLTMLGRRKNISKGFVISIKHWLALNEGKAIDLDKGEKA